MDQDGALKWRDVLEKHHAAMLGGELGRPVPFLTFQNAVLEALSYAEKAQLKAPDRLAPAMTRRRSHAELLNQDLRRQRLAATQEQALQVLLESCGPFADKAVVLVFEKQPVAHLVGAKGL